MDPVALWHKRCIYKVPAFRERSKPESLRASVSLLRSLPSRKGTFDANGGAQAPRSLPFSQKVKQASRVVFRMSVGSDGCFMLEFLRCNTNGPPDDYFGYDPIFSYHGELHILSIVRRDMLLLENQLPIMVLHKLVAAEAGEEDEEAEEHVHRLVCSFYYLDPVTILRGLHMLDVVRNFLVGVEFPHFRTTRKERTYTSMIDLIGSAMDLHEAGIRFKWSGTGDVKDISFEDGVLSLPLVLVGNSMESSFLNLIAFERLHIGAGTEVTNYVFFLGCILKSVRDVSLLESQDIIKKAIGSNQDIVEIFKSLSKEISRDHEDKLDQVYDQIIMYRSKLFNRVRAQFCHAYHVSTEWSPLAYWSIILAILLLALSVLQTAYTICRLLSPSK
ncbi:hypothetical protein Acr_05g0003570 [Actinidia rufa]|uniref:Transmembrane protein n=1 Tax=Actinidia rufa TaxID=165716 RepID=A0A7J0EJS5_9ERIC|nr:hypothetical protein Acr_05g0003570 [Actinidia rufa]